ncbi:MAG: cupin domain-containing protein [Halobacteriota archaeon]|uniref:cupin domain-containing protein n=1 Tax=Natronomonas sp. TaxID=2184060 RepID=UPI003975ED76
MKKIGIDDLDDWMGPASVKRPVGSALDAEHLGMNYYELQPGESFAFGYHAHDDQEELFYVLDGKATFETEAGDVTVEAGEVIRFAPGEFQQGRNDTDDRVRALAVGAPADSTDVTILRDCEECDDRTAQRIEAAEARDELLTTCVECGVETGRFS